LQCETNETLPCGAVVIASARGTDDPGSNLSRVARLGEEKLVLLKLTQNAPIEIFLNKNEGIGPKSITTNNPAQIGYVLRSLMFKCKL
jgi:hypothetical protein